MADQGKASDDAYFRASDSRIRFELGPVNVRTLRDRAVVLLLRTMARCQRRKETRLYGKIEAAIREDDQPSLMILYARLADLYTAFGHTPTLLEVRRQTLRLAERLNEWPLAAKMAFDAGDNAWELERNDEAVELHEKALEHAERAGDEHIVAMACERLADLCRDTDPELSKRMIARSHGLDGEADT